ncbi:hypothetical protein ILUMI_01177 [Ignelater luminosus]|uniref:Uncharacterized protein n=1 Tax=Ignelater luminosus TaxID=2038154 RepID=A0A8K0GPG9_IGNLU|nr:hypothetical protein ILUMI_01177 [Ignelater luminosus]
MSNDYILQSVKDGVKIIKFNRPAKKNAISREMYAELTKILNEDAQNDSIVVTVLTGVGEYYTSGNDLSSASSMDADEDYEQMMDRRVEVVRRFVTAFIDYPKLLIAVVNGPCIGIGATTLSLCDVVYASDRATFLTPFVDLGICAEACSSYLYPRTMGRSKASEMLLLGRKITAQEAYEFGLVSKVVPHERLGDVFNDLMKYGQLPVNTLKANKRLIMTNLKDRLHEINVTELKQLKECFTSEEMFAALARFASRKSKL